jgi:hypothetical protein
MSLLIAIVFLANIETHSFVDSTGQPWFAFSYDDGWGTQLDTYRGTLTADAGGKTINIVLSRADLDSVRQAAIEVRILELPEPHPLIPRCTWGLAKPNSTARLMVSLGSVTKAFSWNTGYSCTDSDEWKRLLSLQAVILRIIYRQPEFGSLPGTGVWL